jgi:RNA polymerase sporulation-specific sigma factor
MKPTDKDLVIAAQNGNAHSLDILLERYRGIVKVKAYSFVPRGLERDDMLQEGMIGLFKAIRDYKLDARTSFRSFADVCIDRQIVTAIRAATRKKHAPLNSYLPLSVAEATEVKEATSPLRRLIAAENLNETKDSFEEMLTDREVSVIRLRMAGKSYRDIAVKLSISQKSVDNALSRAKNKLKR